MDREVKRQLFHLGLGLFFVFLLYYGTIELLGSLPPFRLFIFFPSVTRVLFVILLLCIPLIPLSRKYKVPGIESLLDHFEREKDRELFPGKGAFFFAFGAFIVSLFFEKSIILASLIILSLGDSISHLIGRYGKVNHPLSDSKRIEGHIVGILLGGLGACLFVPFLPAFFTAFIAMITEGINFGKKIDWFLDDNLMVTLVSGITLYFILKFE